MEVHVVECPCGKPKPHRKFLTEDGRECDVSFFSITQGGAQLRKLRQAGGMNSAEFAVAQRELLECGLPQEADLTEKQLLTIASIIINGTAPEEYENVISLNIRDGLLSTADAERVRQYLKDPEAITQAAGIEATVEVASMLPPRMRETFISRAIREGIITEESAKKVREKLESATELEISVKVISLVQPRLREEAISLVVEKGVMTKELANQVRARLGMDAGQE